MEKNLDDNSGSFAHKAEDMNTGDNNTTHSSAPEPEEKLDAKMENSSETKNAADSEQDQDPKEEEKEKKEEEKEEEKEEGKEEETVEAQPPPDSPPPILEKVSEDIDQLLLTLQHNVDATTTLDILKFVPIFLQLVDEKVAKYETSAVKWGETEEDDSFFLDYVNRISRLVKHFAEHPQSHEKEEQEEDSNHFKGKIEFLVNALGAIQQRAMSFLEDEFRTQVDPKSIEQHQKAKQQQQQQQHAEAESSESEPPAETVIDSPCIPEQIITKLRKIAKEMIAGGYENECYQVYALSRKYAFEDGLHNVLGFDKISIDEVQRMQWELLEREIPPWINTWKECTSLWFPEERRLADSVFVDKDSTNTVVNLFMNLSWGVMIQLLNFAESVAMTKRASEKLFKFLDMYETLRDVIQNMESLFPADDGDIKAETTSAKCRLGEAAVLIFCDLENSIKSETGKTPVAGGAVHPLTRYIMNYLRLACEYKETLEEVFKEHSKIERADSTSMPRHEVNKQRNNNNYNQKEEVSPFASQLMRVMELLDTNLEGKAKLYKDVALSSIFMMNNGRYIVQKVKGSAEIYDMMGETWCRKRSTELRTFHKNYQVETWSKILSYLSPKGLNDNGKVQKPILKERFKSFNAAFEEIHKTQSSWVVYDEQLQSELRVSISALVIPAYRSFLGRFSQYLDPGRQTEKYVKYQAEDVETYIDELFDGNAGRR